MRPCTRMGGVILILLGLNVLLVSTSAHSAEYYGESCPRASSIVREKTYEMVRRKKDLAGALLRLHFHDCFVRGCDASILLDSDSNSGEKDSPPNKGSLRGYEQIDEIKAALEAECPGVVSCADVLALAARDATVKIGGPYWHVALGRKDGFVTSFEEALRDLPNPQGDFAHLEQNFAAAGFNKDELVVLSGAHTIGKSTCESVLPRLYNFNGVAGQTDPSLDVEFAEELKRKCPEGREGSTLRMDPTRNTFDHLYFRAVLANKGLFHSDAQLLADEVGRSLVHKYSKAGSSFFGDFAAAMNKMSNMGWASHGQVRRICSRTN